MATIICKRAVPFLPVPVPVPVPAQRYHLYDRRRHRSFNFATESRPLKSTVTEAAASLTCKSSSSSPSSYLDGQSSLLQTLSSRQKNQISIYVSAFLEWNQRMNLTAVKEEGEVMTRHIEDSLSILSPIHRSYVPKDSAPERTRVIDVGSGAGLPGIVFAVACPGWEVTLLESMQKRCLFLEHVVDLMGLSNVNISCNRAEIAGQKSEYREVFDIAMARAVAEMRILAEYCLPFVRVGGIFVAAKGHDPEEEIRRAKNALQLLGASISDICSVESYSPHGQRTAVICLKERTTPRRYPRQPGIPSKSPL